MRRMFSARIILSVVLCLGLQTSLCTGGSLAFFNGASQQLALASDDSVPMSYASFGYLTCKDNSSSSKSVTTPDSGCGDASDCLIQAFQFSAHQALISLSPISEISLPLLVIHSDHTPPMQHGMQLARAGPLYPQAKEYSHIVFKRE